MFAQLVITETFAKPATLIGASVFAYFKGVLKDDPDWNPKMKVAEEVVWIIYFQTINLFAIIYSPYFALIQPILIYIIFITYYLFVQNLAQKIMSDTKKDVST